MSSLEEDPFVVAAVTGKAVVLPEDDQLFLDIDDPKDLEVMGEMVAVLSENGEVVTEEKRTRSPGGNTHVYLRLKYREPLSPLLRIALQACLGSDRKRELLSILRVVHKLDRPPTVFFETED